MKTKLTAIAILLVVGIVGAFFVQRVSAAQSRLLFLPVRGTWYICQGYNTSQISHKGEDIYGLDFSPDKGSFSGAYGCSKKNKDAPVATGAKVYAPADGTLFYYRKPDILHLKLKSGGCMKIAHLSKTAMTIPSSGKSVKQNTLIGYLAGPNTLNGNFAHLHISAYSDTKCKTPVAFEVKSNFQIFNAPNFPATTTKYAYRGKYITNQTYFAAITNDPLGNMGQLLSNATLLLNPFANLSLGH